MLLPWWLKYAAVGALAVAAGGYGWVKGANGVQTRWDAAVLQQEVVVLKVKAAQAEVTERVVTRYVDRVRVVRNTADAVLREVPIYVRETCDPDGRLPASWRVLHDAAVGGSAADPARFADALPVDPQTAARTVVANYAACRETAEQLTALQQWADEQARLR